MLHFALRVGNLLHFHSLARLRADLRDILNRRIPVTRVSRGEPLPDECDRPTDAPSNATVEDETGRWWPDETWLSLP
jgi:hypothetical protein